MKRSRSEFIALFLIIGLIAVLMSFAHRDDVDFEQMAPSRVKHSSYRAFPEGQLALYMVLQQLGYHTQRLTRPFSPEFLPSRGTLIISDAYQNDVTPYEARELRKWLARGNHALVAVEYHPKLCYALQGVKDVPGDPQLDPSDFALPVTGESLDWWDEQSWWAQVAPIGNSSAQPGKPILPSFLSRTAPKISVKSCWRFPKKEPLPNKSLIADGGAVPLFSDASGICVAYTAVGKGGIVWHSSPWSFSNAGIKEGDNLKFVLALANLQPQAPIIFDEYHHGVGAGMNVWTLTPTTAKLGFLQLAIALGLLFITLAWRFGPPRLPDIERFSRSRAEYLTAMAGLLERARATHMVRDRLNLQLRRHLAPRLGLPTYLPLAKVVEAHAAARFPLVDHAALEKVARHFESATRQERPDPDHLLRLAAEVHDLITRKKMS